MKKNNYIKVLEKATNDNHLRNRHLRIISAKKKPSGYKNNEYN